jgi:uncharacterized protein DUF1924
MKQSVGLAGALAAVCGALVCAHAAAATPVEIRKSLEAEARQADPDFAGFSPQRGRQFFTTRRENGWSCASCHNDPLGWGKHVVTGKEISPIAPGADPRRFSDPAKVQKWFRRNCNDVLKRDCTALEKGDLLAYLLSIGGK